MLRCISKQAPAKLFHLFLAILLLLLLLLLIGLSNGGLYRWQPRCETRLRSSISASIAIMASPCSFFRLRT